jgi:predicted extracellular nuclease
MPRYFLRLVLLLGVAALLAVFAPGAARTTRADATAHALCPSGTATAFSQNWTNTGLITANDDWSGVPSIIGYLGEDASTTTGGIDPTTLTADALGTVDVIANQNNPATLTNGGVAEFEITNPVVALQGSGTADAPSIVITLNSTGVTNTTLAYRVRDIDSSSDNAAQQFNAQYRVGTSGTWTNIPGTYIADATEGGTATLVTDVTAFNLPAGFNGNATVQIRFMTTNAPAADEWIGVDDIVITPTCSVGIPECTGIAGFPYTLPSGTLAQLRQAILCANANGTSADEINLGGATVSVISSYADYSGDTGLPQITTPITIRNGTINRPSGGGNYRLLAVSSTGDLTLRDLTVSGGFLGIGANGGAILSSGTLTIRNSTLTNNNATDGGAIHHGNTGVLSILNSTVSSNSGSIGSAIVSNSVTRILSSTISGNTASTAYAIVASSSAFSALEIRNTVISGNVGGAALYMSGSGTKNLINITMTGNYAATGTGTFVVDGSGVSYNLRNSILWNNSGGQPGILNGATGMINTSIVQGFPDPAPTFITPLNPSTTASTAGDFRLAANSAGIDTGDNDYVPGDVRDVDGDGNTSEEAPDRDLNPRRVDDAGVTDGGNGTAPIVDRGAYERQTNSPLPPNVDFCNLQFPTTFSAASNTVSPVIYGRIFEDDGGINTATAGAHPSISAQLGYGPQGSDPRNENPAWRWFPASYNVQVGNDDEYQATFTVPYAPTNTQLSYTYRFTIDSGASYVYCDTDGNGSNSGLSFSTGSLGTLTINSGGQPVVSINNVTANEGNSGTTNFNFTVSLNGPSITPVTFDVFTSNNTATLANNDYTQLNLTGVSVPAGDTTYSLTAQVNGDTDFEPDESFFVTLTNLTNATFLNGIGTATITNDDTGLVCGAAPDSIFQLQDGGSKFGQSGTFTVDGIVTLDLQASGQGDGFAIQDPTGDGNTATSDAIFVFDPSPLLLDVTVGQYVRVTGTVSEFAQNFSDFPAGVTSLTQTQLVATNVQACTNASVPTITPVAVTLPFASLNDQERYEHMLVTFSQTLSVTEMFLLGRYNQISLSVNGRLFQPTNFVAPGAAAIAQQDLNNRSRIILDDNRRTQNPDPISYPAPALSATNVVRGGDTVANLTGVYMQVNSRFGNGTSTNTNPFRYVLIPTTAVSFTSANPRPTSAPSVGGDITVANMNVLNYFNNFTGCYQSGGFSNSNCRGAENATEFTRQRDKTIAAVLKIDPAVLGINELENDIVNDNGGANGATIAIADLVNGLNAATAPGTYAFIDTGRIGTDAIRVGLIYQPSLVAPVGSFAILDSVAPFNVNTRPPLAQKFEYIASGEEFIVIVNHFKSKGSCPGSGANADQGDGQSCWNADRVLAAQEMVNWIDTNAYFTGEPDVLIIGDLNSYAAEDPITYLESEGYTDLIQQFVGAGNVAYSYVFDGQHGYLDHALGSASLLAKVTGVAEYHLNADEAPVLDYNTNFKTVGQQTSLYAANEFRNSDHDPVMVGLNLTPPTADLSITKTDGQTSVVAGNTVTYTIVASNAGPSAVTGATVADTLLASLQSATWTCVGAGGGTCTASGSGNISDTVNLPVGSSVTYTVNATLSSTAIGTLNNTATVSSSVSDPNPANNSATDINTITQSADLSISKTSGGTSVIAGSPVTYTIIASNAGPSYVSSATVADTLPAVLQSATWTCVGAGGGTCTASGSGNLNDTVNLPAGASVTFVINATLSGTATGTLTNTATVSSAVTDPDPANNSESDSDTIITSGVTISESGGVTNLTEGGATDTYTVVLNSQPTADVTITVVNSTQATASPNTLTFTSANWNVPQTVTVTAIDDLVVEGPHSGSITHTAASADTNYNGITIASVSFGVTDNDSAGVTVSPTTVNVTEGGATDTYTVVLNTQPTADVTITVVNSTQATASPNTLTFTSANWNVAQTVTVTAIDDLVVEGPHSGSITHTAASADTNYNGITIASVSFGVTDNDTAGLTLSPTTVNAAEGGATGSYTVVLNTQPTANVTVNVNNGSQTSTIVPNLTFTSANWNVPQTVIVTAFDDDTTEGAHTGLIAHSTVSSDPAYNVGPIVLTVNITDNDVAGLFIVGGPVNVTEGGATGTYTVRLTSQPSNDVSVAITGTAQATASPTPLTFTSANWNIDQTVTVTAVDDAVSEGAHSTIIVNSTTSADAAFNGLTLNLLVNITDNDAPLARELLVNGGFELLGPSDGTAANWTGNGLLVANDRRTCNNPNRVVAAEGRCAFRFGFTGTVINGARTLSQSVSLAGLNAGDTLTLSGLVRADALVGNARIRVRVRYANGSETTRNFTITSGTYAYSPFLASPLTLTGTPTRVLVVVMPLSTTGVFFVDGLSLTVQDSVAAPEQPLPLPPADNN